MAVALAPTAEEWQYLRVLGAVIRFHRKARGWKQRDFSLACKLSQPMVSRVETGHQVVRLDTLRKLAEGLGVSAGSLLEETDYYLEHHSTVPKNQKTLFAAVGDWREELEAE